MRCTPGWPGCGPGSARTATPGRPCSPEPARRSARAATSATWPNSAGTRSCAPRPSRTAGTWCSGWNGPAIGLGCSLVALSDVVYLGEDAYLKDPHVQVGLVAADGGPLTWPLHTSLHLAKEYALTGARIPGERALAMGLANHVVADPLAEATACAQRIAGLPRQAVESTKRLLNLHLERAVLATIDYATTAEEQSFQTDDFRTTIAKLT
jgi:enoyl-CoA hydratase/carnithine racemase